MRVRRVHPWSRAVVVGALLVLSARPPGAVPPLDLGGSTFSGTYLQTGAGTPRSVQIEFEKQHHRRLRISVFAVDQPEFQGRGKLSKDNTTVTAATRATGRGNVPRLLFTATVGGGGNSLSGDYTVKRKGHSGTTGTFAVAR